MNVTDEVTIVKISIIQNNYKIFSRFDDQQYRDNYIWDCEQDNS